MNPYYNQLALDGYHSAYFYTQNSEYENNLLEQVLRVLQLSAHHSVCDMGSGTGWFAHRIHQTCDLEQPVICVDSAENMLSGVPSGTAPVCMDMESYVSEAASQTFDRVLIKEAIHHIPTESLEPFFKHICKMLRPDGRMVIVTRPQYVDYPIPERAKTIWADTQLDFQVYVDKLYASGFQSVTVTTHEYPVELESTKWIQMIRNRMWSVFSEKYFTQQELDEWSIPGPNTTFTERLIFICAQQPAAALTGTPFGAALTGTQGCNGDGTCLYQCDCECYDENTGQPLECTCGHREHDIEEGCPSDCCVPIECLNYTECLQKAPQWYLDAHDGRCVNCANDANDATPDGDTGFARGPPMVANRINRIEECYCCLECKPRLELPCNHNICKECWYRLNAYIISVDLVCLRCKEDEITARKIQNSHN